MLLLTTSLVLSAILMAHADPIEEDLKVKPLSESLLLFDVTSSASASDTKSAFGDVHLRHSFKVIGENRYIFVTTYNNNNTAIESLTFPAGFSVKQYPIEHASDYYKMFGITHRMEEKDVDALLHSDSLSFDEVEILIPANTPTCVFKERTRNLVEAISKALEKINIVMYFAVAYYPPKMFIFANNEENISQNIFLHAVDTFGNPGNAIVVKKGIMISLSEAVMALHAATKLHIPTLGFL